jgi:hypothetical protein
VPNTLRIVCRFAPIRQKLLVYLTGRYHLIRVNIPQFQKGKNRPSGLFGVRHAGHQQTLSIQTLRADGRRINDFILLKKSSGIGPEPGRPHGDCPRVAPLDEAIAAIRDFVSIRKRASGSMDERQTVPLDTEQDALCLSSTMRSRKGK